MELIRDHWTQKDGKDFQAYLKSIGNGEEKGRWEQNILKTNMPCLAIPSPQITEITKQISKGNFIEFIDLWLWDYYTNTAIIGNLICQIKDFTTFETYLVKYSQKIDNWASCDCLKFNINAKNTDNYFAMSQKMVKSKFPFERRMGLSVLLFLCRNDKYIDGIFNIINSFTEEQEYYVNMMNAWLIAECFIKQREKTLNFLRNHTLNKFTINKAISKCRDSFRVSQEDKDMLVQFRVK